MLSETLQRVRQTLSARIGQMFVLLLILGCYDISYVWMSGEGCFLDLRTTVSETLGNHT